METYIHNKGSNGPVIIWGMHMWQGDEMDKLISSLDLLVPDASYILAAFDPENWNDAFTPWEAVCDGQTFNGHGPDTLDWLQDTYVPDLKKSFPDSSGMFIAGYSLSGLFSLWALYESDLFDGAASCSGSLWFPEWDQYISGHKADKNSIAYLSLGGKEKNSKSSVISTIEDRTKAQYDLFNGQISKAKFEMNPGGHFSNPEMRTAKGIAWLLSNNNGGLNT